MLENGDITPAEAASAEPAEVQIVPTPKSNSFRYFTDWALPQLDMMIDETVEPIEVWTTLDLEMQRTADAAINANTPAGAQGALVALDRGGAVRAMIGGRDYVRSEEHTSELQSLMRISYAVFCLQKKNKNQIMLYAS